jgi:hypothetical protein
MTIILIVGNVVLTIALLASLAITTFFTDVSWRTFCLVNGTVAIVQGTLVATLGYRLGLGNFLGSSVHTIGLITVGFWLGMVISQIKPRNQEKIKDCDNE